MTVDPFGRAVRDAHRGELSGPLLQRDGEATSEHPIERYYFEAFTAEDDRSEWLASWLDGPLLDAGAGAGRHALYFQESFETVALETSAHLVETMRERGVVDARQGDMFALREAFERDRFQSVLSYGTQLGLAGSMQGLREFLSDLASVTTADATAVVDCYDPAHEAATELLGYRSDPTDGLAYRMVQFEYDGVLGEPLLFRLFGPDRLREATVGTAWDVAEVRRDDGPGSAHYLAALAKPDADL